MFGFLDTKTPALAERLYARATRDRDRYLKLTLAEAAELIRNDNPEMDHFVGHDQIAYVYPDLPDFSFSIISFLGPLTLSIDSAGLYSGMLMQFTADQSDANVSIQKPIRAPIGPKAKRLANHLELTFGVRNLNRALGSLMHERY